MQSSYFVDYLSQLIPNLSAATQHMSELQSASVIAAACFRNAHLCWYFYTEYIFMKLILVGARENQQAFWNKMQGFFFVFVFFFNSQSRWDDLNKEVQTIYVYLSIIAWWSIISMWPLPHSEIYCLSLLPLLIITVFINLSLINIDEVLQCSGQCSRCWRSSIRQEKERFLLLRGLKFPLEIDLVRGKNGPPKKSTPQSLILVDSVMSHVKKELRLQMKVRLLVSWL